MPSTSGSPSSETGRIAPGRPTRSSPTASPQPSSPASPPSLPRMRSRSATARTSNPTAGLAAALIFAPDGSKAYSGPASSWRLRMKAAFSPGVIDEDDVAEPFPPTSSSRLASTTGASRLSLEDDAPSAPRHPDTHAKRMDNTPIRPIQISIVHSRVPQFSKDNHDSLILGATLHKRITQTGYIPFPDTSLYLSGQNTI